MPLKYWSRAGLMLTDGCNAACAACYLHCAPDHGTWMSLEQAVGVWAGLESLSPHGCRVHVTGGEPFIDFPRLLEILRAARREGLVADAVETNGFWASDEATIRDRLGALDAEGVRRLTISADPFHQQFIPIDRVRRLAGMAEELLGPARVRVRWRDWLETGQDTAHMPVEQRRKLFSEWLATGRDRLNGRAAETLADLLPGKPVEAFAGANCREALLRSRHVHVLPDGNIMPGVCAGLTLGRVQPPFEASLRAIWEGLEQDHAARPILGRLITAGPAGLLELAPKDFAVRKEGYASKCHLCWILRQALMSDGADLDELAPRRT